MRPFLCQPACRHSLVSQNLRHPQTNGRMHAWVIVIGRGCMGIQVIRAPSHRMMHAWQWAHARCLYACVMQHRATCLFKAGPKEQLLSSMECKRSFRGRWPTLRWKHTRPKRGGADTSKRSSLRMRSATVSARRMWCLYRHSHASHKLSTPTLAQHAPSGIQPCHSRPSIV